MTRRTEWFVTKSPRCSIGREADQLHDFVRAAALHRSDARALAQARALSGARALGRQARHRDSRALSHRSGQTCIRRFKRADGSRRRRAQPEFFEDVAGMVQRLSRTDPDPPCSSSCSTTSTGLTRATAAWRRRRSGTSRPIRGATSKWSTTRRSCRICPCAWRRSKRRVPAKSFTGDDLQLREFLGNVAAGHRKASSGPPSEIRCDFSRRRNAARARRTASPSTGDSSAPRARRRAARRVDELIAADGDAHVRGAGRDRREEHEVARLARRPRSTSLSRLELLAHFARHLEAVLREDVLHEAAAIESRRVGAAVPVRRAAQRSAVDESTVVPGDRPSRAAARTATRRWTGDTRPGKRAACRRDRATQPHEQRARG